ncbi:MAG: response regulator [Myxococcota bacterium]|nr:response regulator [Myxococcota bacterium]
MHILIVEDEVAVQAVLSEFLSSFGYSIDVLGTGREAIEHIRSHCYDVAIIDWRLPGITGRDVILELLATSPNTQIIATTGQISQRLRHIAAAEARVQIVPKPFSLRKLHKLIQAAHAPGSPCENSRTQRAAYSP